MIICTALKTNKQCVHLLFKNCNLNFLGVNWLYTLIKRRSKSCCQRSPTKTLFSKRSQKEKWRKEFRNTTNNTLNIDNACPSLVMLLHFYVEYITPQRLCKFAMPKKKVFRPFFFSKKSLHFLSACFIWFPMMQIFCSKITSFLHNFP